MNIKKVILKSVCALLVSYPVAHAQSGPGSPGSVQLATLTTPGLVQPDGTSCSVTTGLISCSVPYVTQRSPNKYDDSSKGFAVGNIWRVPGGSIFQATGVSVGAATWVPYPGSAYLGRALACDQAINGTTAAGAAMTVYTCGSVIHQVVAGWTGAAFQVQRASDSTTQTEYWNADGTQPTAALQAFCAATTCRVMIVYDESGNGRNWTQSTFGTAPAIMPQAQFPNGAWSMTFDTPQPSSSTCRDLVIPSSVAPNAANMSIVATVRWANTGNVNGTLLEMANTSYSPGTFVFGAENGYVISGSTGLYWQFVYESNSSFEIPPPVTASVVSLVMTASGYTMAVNDAFHTGSATNNSALAGGSLGGCASNGGGAGKGGYLEVGDLIISTAMSASTAQEVKMALYNAAQIVPQVKAQIVFDGDSLINGFYANYLQTPARLASYGISYPAAIYNSSHFGDTIAGNGLGRFQLNVGQLASNGSPITIVVEDYGSNDIYNGASASATLANQQTYCSQAHALGALLVVATMTARQGISSANEAQRIAYNTALLANSGTCKFDAVADPGGNPELAVLNSGTGIYYIPTVYTADGGTHFNDAGYAIYSGLLAAKVNLLLSVKGLLN